MPDSTGRRSGDASKRAWISAGAPIVVLVLVVIMLAFALVASFARRQDQDFASESARLVMSAVDERMRALSNLTLDYAMWDDAYVHVSGRWDLAWLENNYYSAVADGLVVFRADGEIRYVWTADALAEGGPALALATAQAALSDMTLPRGDAERPADLATHGLFVHDGRLVLISAAAISFEDAGARRAAAGARGTDYLAMIDVVDAAELADIGRRLDLEEIAFAAAPAGRGRIALPLGAASGRPLGELSWRDEKPGSAAFLGQMWPIVLCLIIVGALTVLISRRLAATYLQSIARADAALEASRLKSEFISTMSHELRTPLNAIIGYAELIQEEAAPIGERVIAQDAGRVVNAAKHLRQLVNDILDQSRIDAGRLQFTIERVAVAGVLADVVELAAPLAHANGNALRAIEPAPGLEALADDVRIRQCLLNLVGNAAKSTTQGSITVAARREATPKGDFIVFDVADTGAGVAPEDLERLFRPFMQVEAALEGKYAGAGLGLSIARKLARAMGGDISARSEVGRGSVFSLSIPAAPATAREEAA